MGTWYKCVVSSWKTWQVDEEEYHIATVWIGVRSSADGFGSQLCFQPVVSDKKPKQDLQSQCCKLMTFAIRSRGIGGLLEKEKP